MVFIAGIASAWARGLAIDCGCFGSGGQLADGQDPGYLPEILRDLGFLALAGFLLIWPRTPRLGGRLAVAASTVWRTTMSSRKGQRDAARVVREQTRPRAAAQAHALDLDRRGRVLVIAGVIGWAVWSSQNAPTSFTTPPGANAAGTGIVTGGGPVTVDVYEDFLCPACKQFEQTSGRDPRTARRRGQGEGGLPPRRVPEPLLRPPSTPPAPRPPPAAPPTGGKYHEYAEALFAQQPPEGSAGLSNDQLIDIGAGVGLDRD